jgi:RNA polymerase sigma factor for flagellar operon FliA
MNKSGSTISLEERDKLIAEHQNYARKLTAQIFQSLSAKVDFEELNSYGLLGLVEAAERYDPTRGASFVTFSYHRIRGAIFDGLRQMGYFKGENKTKAWQANVSELLQSASDDFDASSGQKSLAVDNEIEAVGLLFDDLITSYILSVGLDEVEELVDPGLSPYQQLAERDELHFILKVVEELSEDEQELIRQIYFQQISMTKIAEQRGTTKSWISRLHTRTIQHLRDKLREKGILETPSAKKKNSPEKSSSRYLNRA